ncbi:12360_t:CDS:2 [Gigaspora margarita]|uniref:12360_t:CDS:1 n=1 Tax=Gigaspora margarita TaxID=4874 RepID=A0ABN7UFC3_GIGMA|nr:12360_t:CDS:2 [Gigaspora margarita]
MHIIGLLPRPRGDSTCDNGVPCGNKYSEINKTTISSFLIKGYSIFKQGHPINGTLFYLYTNDCGTRFNPSRSLMGLLLHMFQLFQLRLLALIPINAPHVRFTPFISLFLF